MVAHGDRAFCFGDAAVQALRLQIGGANVEPHRTAVCHRNSHGFGERTCLLSTALMLPPAFVACEIGSYLGASTGFLAAAANFKGGHVRAVDTWLNDAMDIEPVEDTFERFQENTHSLREFITTHRGRAEAMEDRIPALDLLFIDGDHSCEAVLRDLTNYAGKIKPGGVLAVLDFEQEPVRRAVGDYSFGRALSHTIIESTLQVYRVE
jgi:predicted O-methyltransferase YrrM